VSGVFCQIFTNIGLILIKILNVEFDEHVSSGCRALSYGQTDEHDGAISRFHDWFLKESKTAGDNLSERKFSVTHYCILKNVSRHEFWKKPD
jgi:hypothetical protein